MCDRSQVAATSSTEHVPRHHELFNSGVETIVFATLPHLNKLESTCPAALEHASPNTFVRTSQTHPQRKAAFCRLHTAWRAAFSSATPSVGAFVQASDCDFHTFGGTHVPAFPDNVASSDAYNTLMKLLPAPQLSTALFN